MLSQYNSILEDHAHFNESSTIPVKPIRQNLKLRSLSRPFGQFEQFPQRIKTQILLREMKINIERLADLQKLIARCVHFD